MIDHGYERAKVDAIKVDRKDIAERVKLAHVIALAATMQDTVGIHAPMVNGKRNRVLISGRDRMAAHIINKTKTIWVHVVEADAKEVEDLTEIENLYRRPIANRDELMARRVAKVAKDIEAAAPAKGKLPDPESGKSAPPPKAAPGRPETAKGQAIKQVAKETGRSPEAVRKSVAKAEKPKANLIPASVRKLEAAEAKRTAAQKNPPVNPRGLDLPAAWSKLVWAILDGLQEANKTLTAAQAELTKLATPGLLLLAPGLQQLSEMVHSAAAAARGLMPAAVCPYCKDPDGTMGRRLACGGCGGCGYLCESKWSNRKDIPDELMAAGAKAVVSDWHGGYILLSAANEAAKAESAPAAAE